jgi:predicted GIY-YIG superfamily endonuclease
MIINKHTLLLQQKITELEYQKQRQEICDVIKRSPKEWKERLINSFEPTEKELEYIIEKSLAEVK